MSRLQASQQPAFGAPAAKLAMMSVKSTTPGVAVRVVKTPAAGYNGPAASVSGVAGVLLTKQKQTAQQDLTSQWGMWAQSQRQLESDLKHGRAMREKDSNVMPPRQDQVTTEVADEFTIYKCGSLSQWNSPESDKYQGLCVQRSFHPEFFKAIVQNIAAFGEAKRVEYVNPQVSRAEFVARLKLAGEQLSMGLPVQLAKMINQDAQAMAWAVAELLPEAKEIIIKLEQFGTSVCGRWHTDNYVARALVTYNCSGTEYTSDSNTDFYEMEHCGNNDHIIRDKSLVRSINVGDILLIKGDRFPGSAKRFVHKSPAPQFHADGSCITRLVLKVDVE